MERSVIVIDSHFPGLNPVQFGSEECAIMYSAIAPTTFASGFANNSGLIVSDDRYNTIIAYNITLIVHSVNLMVKSIIVCLTSSLLSSLLLISVLSDIFLLLIATKIMKSENIRSISSELL